MAKTVCYKVYASGLTGTNVNIATAQVVARGKIVAVALSGYWLGGAGTGSYTAECGLNASIGGTGVPVNNPSRLQTLGVLPVALANAAYSGPTISVSGLAIPVQAGDIISIGGYATAGTAPSSGIMFACVYVHED